jgi:hypothetical protein
MRKREKGFDAGRPAAGRRQQIKGGFFYLFRFAGLAGWKFGSEKMPMGTTTTWWDWSAIKLEEMDLGGNGWFGRYHGLQSWAFRAGRDQNIYITIAVPREDEKAECHTEGLET